jgi:hypothetical protein
LIDPEPPCWRRLRSSVGLRALDRDGGGQPNGRNADLSASVTSVTIPAEYLEPSTKYKLEAQAIEKSGNQTISAIPFRVGWLARGRA